MGSACFLVHYECTRGMHTLRTEQENVGGSMMMQIVSGRLAFARNSIDKKMGLHHTASLHCILPRTGALEATLNA